MNQRGFVLVEFVIALTLLIFLLYALGNLTFKAMKISREQVADYTLETEAQEIIDRITTDARVAHSVEITNWNFFEKIKFICHVNKPNQSFLYDVLDPRIYAVDSANSKFFHIYFKRDDDSYYSNPIISKNFFGNNFVKDFSFYVPAPKVLHITFKMESLVTHRKVRFSTAVYMPACKKIYDKGTNYVYE